MHGGGRKAKPDLATWTVDGRQSRLTVQPPTSGTYVLGVSSMTSSSTRSAAEFADYLRIEDRPDTLATYDPPKFPNGVTYEYTKHARTIGQAGDAVTDDSPRRSGIRWRSACQRVALTLEECVAQLVPRIETALWSAPISDGKQAMAEPRVFCMSSDSGQDASGKVVAGSVSCITEQGTPWAMDPKAARMVARKGAVYNPFRRPVQEHQAQARQGAGVGAAHGDAVQSASMSAGQIGAYGDIGITPNPGPRSDNPGVGTGG